MGKPTIDSTESATPFQFTIGKLLIATAMIALAVAPWATWGSDGGLGTLAILFFYGVLIWRCSVEKRVTLVPIIEAVSIWCIAVTLVTVMIPMPHSRGPNHSSKCQNNLRQLALGILNYESAYSHFPPPYTVDEDGNPLHSWRVHILPHIEQLDLYEQIDLMKPWDHPVNVPFHSKMPKLFSCPANQSASLASGLTPYLAITGDETMMCVGTKRSLGDVTDGSSSSLLLIESKNNSVNWMSPNDLEYKKIVAAVKSGKVKEILNSDHFGGCYGATGDAGTHLLPENLSGEELCARATIAGGENLDGYVIDE